MRCTVAAPLAAAVILWALPGIVDRAILRILAGHHQIP